MAQLIPELYSWRFLQVTGDDHAQHDPEDDEEHALRNDLSFDNIDQEVVI